jgi:hypothetical protein
MLPRLKESKVEEVVLHTELKVYFSAYWAFFDLF